MLDSTKDDAVTRIMALAVEQWLEKGVANRVAGARMVATAGMAEMAGAVVIDN